MLRPPSAVPLGRQVPGAIVLVPDGEGGIRIGGGNGLGLYIVDTLLSSMEISYSFVPMKSPPGMRFTLQI